MNYSNAVISNIRNESRDYESIRKIQEENLKLPISKLSDISKKNISKLCLCTSVMNRLSFLQKSLKNWLDYPFHTIIILDWGSEQAVKDYVTAVEDNRIKYYRVDAAYYDHSSARNIKMGLVPGFGDNSETYVLSIDCDILLTPRFLDKTFLSKNTFHASTAKYAMDGTTGTSVMTKKQFFDIKGCNEDMEGWGHEDLDIYDRLIAAKYNQIQLNPISLLHQNHDDNLRVKHTISKDKWKSNYDNKIVALKGHAFNKKNYNILYPDGRSVSSKELLRNYE